ncbi:hypothetical protein HK405_009782, partial [Cladochytrium tenue]
YHGSGFKNLNNSAVQFLAAYGPTLASGSEDPDYFSSERGLTTENSTLLVARKHTLVVLRHLLRHFEKTTCGRADQPLHLAVASVFLTSSKSDDSAMSSRIPPEAMARLLLSAVDILLYQLERCRSLRRKSSDLQRIPVDEIKEIAIRSGEGFVSELSTAQRLSLAHWQLGKEAKAADDEIVLVMDIVEVLLVVLWRYLTHICGTPLDGTTPTGRQALLQSLGVSVSKLQGIELGPDVVPNSDGRTQFLQMLCRKVRGAVVALSAAPAV